MPFPAAPPTCDPATGLGNTVTITVLVVDPSGVKSVVLLYKRAGDPAPVGVAMTLSAGRYRVTLTSSNAPAWQPVGASQSYVVALSVQATDGKGNVRTISQPNGFMVQRC